MLLEIIFDITKVYACYCICNAAFSPTAIPCYALTDASASFTDHGPLRAHLCTIR